jgi:hypothetical protein
MIRVESLTKRYGDRLAALTPSSAGGAMISTDHAGMLGSPVVGLALWTGYLVSLIALAVWIVARRDA